LLLDSPPSDLVPSRPLPRNRTELATPTTLLFCRHFSKC
jgi:hypothetical protein